MRQFNAVLLNTLISGVNSSLLWFSLSIWIYLMTHSVFATSILSGSYMVAMLITGFVFGPIVDHHRKKDVMLIAEILSFVMVFVALLVYLRSPETNMVSIASPSLWFLVIPVFLSVIISQIRTTSISTLVGIMLPAKDRSKANGLVGTTTGMTFLISPILGGFLLSLSGLYWALVVSLVLHVLAAIHLYSIEINEKLARPHGQKISFHFGQTYRLVRSIPGLFALLIFNSINNFIGGVFGPLVDPYGLSLVSQRTWGIISGLLSVGFMAGGWWISRYGLGKNPLKTLFMTNIFMWLVCTLFTIVPSIYLMVVGIFIYFCLIPFAEASEQTIIQKVVPKTFQGRVFGFGQSIESAATPLSTFLVGPLVQFVYIPFMTTGMGAQLIGSWFGVGDSRGIALLFVTSGIIGTLLTISAMRTRSYRQLLASYQN